MVEQDHMTERLALTRWLNSYQAALNDAEKADPISDRLLLKSLLAREQLASLLSEQVEDSADTVIALVEADQRLRKLADTNLDPELFESWRSTLGPQDSNWWWYLDKTTKKHPIERLNWLWTAISLIILTAVIALITDLARRFLSGGPDATATFAVAIQAVLALMVAGGVLTKTGKHIVKGLTTKLSPNLDIYGPVSVILGLALLGVVFLVYVNLPRFAQAYNASGRDHHRSGELLSAHYAYKRAISLSPDYDAAHYNLGLLYEDLLQLEMAKAEYQIALNGGLDLAINNLARLHILGNQPSEAVTLLLQGLAIVEESGVRHDMLKNLGWARVIQGRYEEAIPVLEQALSIDPNSGASHCLLALALDGNEPSTQSEEEWLKCSALANSRIAEEDVWLGLARYRLAPSTGEDN